MSTNNNSITDQRQFTRVPKSVKLALTSLTDPLTPTTINHATSTNIAENGLCLTSEQPYKVGSKFKVVINLDGWQLFLRTVLKINEDQQIKPFTATGKVIWSQKNRGQDNYQTGIKFIDIKKDDFDAFKKYLHIIRESVKG